MRTRAVNLLRLRSRFLAWNRLLAELAGAVELDESCSGPQRVRSKRGRGASDKTIAFGLLERGGQVYTETVSNGLKNLSGHYTRQNRRGSPVKHRWLTRLRRAGGRRPRPPLPRPPRSGQVRPHCLALQRHRVFLEFRQSPLPPVQGLIQTCLFTAPEKSRIPL